MRLLRIWLGIVAMVMLLAAGVALAQLPASKGAPKVGEKARDFTLAVASGAGEKKTLTLFEAQKGHAGQWVLLVFYRGYW